MQKIITTASSRPGNMFLAKQETALYPEAFEAANMLLPQLTAFIAEMPSPLGVPDFVGLYGGLTELSTRLDSSIPAIHSPILADVLAVTYSNRALRTSTIAARLNWPISYVKQKLDELEKLDAVQRNANGSWLRASEITSFGTVIAFETKIRDWQGAVLQGRSYRTWADNSVLVLGRLGQKATDRVVTKASTEGFGLYMNGNCLSRPRKRKAKLSRSILAREHLVAALGHQAQPSERRKSSNPSRLASIQADAPGLAPVKS